MKRLLTLLLALLVGGAATADVTIDGPASVEQYTFVKLQAKGDVTGTAFLWRIYDPSGKRLPAASIMSRGDKALFIGPPGDYKVELIACRIDPATKAPVLEEAEKSVTIKGVAPPGPGPGPTPPGPSDPLVKAMQAAYAAETDAAKATQLAGLAALYRQAADDAFLSKCDTWGAAFDAMSAAAKATGVSGKIMGVQKVVQAEIQAKLPSKRTDALTFDGRALASTTFLKIANALGGVK